jgi:hypothetical protein
MTAIAVKEERIRVPRLWRRLGWALAALVALPSLGLLSLWAYGPYWIAPVEDFAQGPGGAIAYVSLYNQIQSQQADFWTGGDVTIEMNQTEFSGMLSSALLSGQSERDPIRKVRAGLADGEIRVETVLKFPYASIPQRYQGPVGLKVQLIPVVADNGVVRFQITRAALGRIPVPAKLIQWAGKLFPITAPGFNPEGPSVMLPVGDMIARQLGRSVTIKQFASDQGKLKLVVAMTSHDKLKQ